ncbi:MAG: PAS domain-containing protein [Alphaproteobacteria bacterium]|nr:PAS domain-containing protein [Alphaproteobacteria bacterium]
MVVEGDGLQGKLVPALERLLAHWRKSYGIRPIPERSRLNIRDLGPWLPHAAWIEVGGDGGPIVRRFGIELIRRFGREATNDRIGDLAPDVAAGLRALIGQATATSAPAIGTASVQLGRHPASFSELALPLAADGARIGLVLLASYEVIGPRPRGAFR